MADTVPGRHVDFEAPPVVEVVCGAVFQPIDGFSAAFFGLLWDRFGEEFTRTADHSPLLWPAQQPPPGHIRVHLEPGVGLPRVWFYTEDRRRLIQVQRDRFHFNWQRREEGDEYPQFPVVYKEYKRHLGTLHEFLSEGGLPEPQPVQYELTYLNHIPVDEVWQGYHHLGRVLPDIAWRDRQGRFLPAPEHLHWEVGFPMKGGAGVLAAKARSVRRRDTGELALALELTARGPAGALAMDRWFRIGHEWIVKSFAELTGQEMHSRIWRRKGDPA